MSAFEWALIGILFLGLVIPAWFLALAAFIASKRPRPSEPSVRYLAYVGLLDSLHRAMDTGTVENGAIYAASIRELKAYPEYRDLSLLYLEEINITGSNKFDQIMTAEMKATEASLLELRNE